MVIYSLFHPPETPPKMQHEYGRKLLKQTLKKEYHIDYAEDMITYIGNKKPVLKQGRIQFNISHCKGLVVCALSEAPIGVDAEGPRQVMPRVIRKACSEKEARYVKEGGPAEENRRFLRLWTLKESYLKMTGEGMRVPFSQVEFEIQGDAREGEWLLPSQILCSHPGYFWQTQLKEHYILSVCSEYSFSKPMIEYVDESFLQIASFDV